MTDLELATAFFERIQAKGFKLKFDKEAYGQLESDGDNFMSIELLNAEGKEFVTFDFYPGGNFYRIMGYTGGYWQDEVDWNKYPDKELEGDK